MYENVKSSILQCLPNVKVVKNNQINYPRIGFFEIMHGQNLIWSKHYFGDFPNPKNIGLRVQNYVRDLIKGKDVQKYQLPLVLNNQKIVKSRSESPRNKNIRLNKFKKDQVKLNEFLGNRQTLKLPRLQSILIQQQLLQNQDISVNQQENSSNKFTKKEDNQNDIYDIFYYQSIFGEDGLPNPEQNIAINDNGIYNLQFQELSQDSFDIDFQVIDKKQEIQKQLYNDSSPTTQNSQNENSTKLQLQNGLYNQNLLISSDKKIEDLNQEDCIYYNFEKLNLTQNNNFNKYEQTYILNEKIKNDEKNIEQKNKNLYQDQKLEQNSSTFDQENIYQQKLQQQEEKLRVSKISQELEIQDRKLVSLLQEIKMQVDNFWFDFKGIYIAYKKNPSFKRFSWDLYYLLAYLKDSLSQIKREYYEKALIFKQMKASSKYMAGLNQKISQQKLQQEEEFLQKEIEIKEQIQIEIKNKNIVENKMKEIEQILSKEKDEFNSKENNFKKKISQLEDEVEEKNKILDELKKINETQHQQIQQRKSQMMEFRQNIELQQANQMSKDQQIENLSQQIQQLQEQLEEKNKNIDLNEQKIKVLQENEILFQNQLEEKIQLIKNLENQIIEFKKENEELRGDGIKQMLKEQLKIEFQKTEKQLQGQLIQIQKQMDLERKKIQNLVLFDPKTIFDPQSELKMGFFFNLQKPDLDKQNFQVHCVFLNELGDLEEKIFEGNTVSKLSEGAIRHSGKKVNHIYDREIFLKLKNVTQDIKVIAFSIQLSDLKMSLKEINQLKIQFFEDQLIVQHFYVKNLDGKISLLFFLVRQPKGQWIFTQIGKDVGHNNIRSLILDNLKFTNFNLNPNIKEILEWKPGSGKVFPIKTHELIPVPQFAYENIVLGLGWETKLDLDSSLVLLNKQGKVIENICFKNLESKDGAIKHQGDSRDGGNQGDDEQIYINLSKLDNQVHQIWVVICIYDSDQGFKSIENTYCRFLCGETEFCRYDLSSIKDSQRNGCLISDLYKMGNKWTIKGRGYFTKDTSTSDDMIPIIQQLYENDYSSIKIIEN